MNQQLIKQMQKMQQDMVKAQKEIEASTFTGKAGGGAVEISIKGSYEVVSVKIDPELLDDKDNAEMLEDSITAAMNQAISAIKETTEDSMGGFTKGLGGGLGGLF